MKLVSCHPWFSKAANEIFPDSVSKGGLSTGMNILEHCSFGVYPFPFWLLWYYYTNKCPGLQSKFQPGFYTKKPCLKKARGEKKQLQEKNDPVFKWIAFNRQFLNKGIHTCSQKIYEKSPMIPIYIFLRHWLITKISSNYYHRLSMWGDKANSWEFLTCSEL